MCPFVFYQIVKNSIGWFFYNKCVFVGSLVGIFYPQLSSTHTIFGPIRSIRSNSFAEKRCAYFCPCEGKADLGWIFPDCRQLHHCGRIAGLNSSWLMQLHSASLCPTSAFRRKCELTSSPYMLVTFTTVGRDKNTSCIISTDSLMHSCDRVFFLGLL